MAVTGCENIGWESAVFTEETIIGPDGIEYFIYETIEVYEDELRFY